MWSIAVWLLLVANRQLDAERRLSFPFRGSFPASPALSGQFLTKESSWSWRRRLRVSIEGQRSRRRKHELCCCKCYLYSRCGCPCLRRNRIIQRLNLLPPASQRFHIWPIPSFLNKRHHRRDYCHRHLRGKSSWHSQSPQAEARPAHLSSCPSRLLGSVTTKWHKKLER